MSALRSIEIRGAGRPPTPTSGPRNNWHASWKAAQHWKEVARTAAIEQVPADFGAPIRRAEVEIEFIVPDRRARDIDNMISSTKATTDGLVAFGLLSDDSTNVIRRVSFSERYVPGQTATVYRIRELATTSSPRRCDRRGHRLAIVGLRVDSEDLVYDPRYEVDRIEGFLPARQRGCTADGRAHPRRQRQAPGGVCGVIRIQRQRTKGSRMPEGAIYVGRPTGWGNPRVVGDPDPTWCGSAGHMTATRWDPGKLDRCGAVYHFGLYARDRLMPEPDWLEPLRGATALSGSCPDDGQPCHADVLIELLAS